jgi:hypothetical protein
MKRPLTLSILFISIIVIVTSCKKTINEPVNNNTDVSRKIQFVLYTDKDQSNDNDVATFRLSIQRLPNLVLWDSVLALMRIKDIPSFAQKLVIEKTVPGNDPSLLKVGFIYSIENVGNSSHMLYSQAGENYKVVDFNFQ